MPISLAFIMMLGFSGCGAVQQCPAGIHRRIPYTEDTRPEHRDEITLRAYRDGRLIWFNKIITMGKLRTYLRHSRALNPLPFLVLAYEEGIDCATLANLRRAFDEDGGCSGETFCSERQIRTGGR